jgi:hypothetical protein
VNLARVMGALVVFIFVLELTASLQKILDLRMQILDLRA